MENEIMVSISCLAYNHEPYIRKCLEGFVNQKTNFKYEVLIHDDASTDKTADVIREYERKYPDIIKPIYQKENQYSKHTGINKTFQYPRIKGKYLAFCEGDDYWCDENKLQKQFDALENNKDCSISLHKVNRIYENGEDSGMFFPDTKISKTILSTDDFFKLLLTKEKVLFQTSSFFIKTSVVFETIDSRSSIGKGLSFGDLPLLLLSATKGNVYYFEDVMSCYRMNSIGSWSSTNQNSEKADNETIKCLTRFDEYTEHKYKKYIYYRINKYSFLKSLRNKDYKNLIKIKNWKYLFRSLSCRDRLYIYFHCFLSLIGKE